MKPSFLIKLLQFDLLQLLNIAGDIRKTIGSVNAANIKLKYGAPTEIFPKFKELVTSGYKVPINIANVVIVKNKLFNNNKNSFDDIAYSL